MLSLLSHQLQCFKSVHSYLELPIDLFHLPTINKFIQLFCILYIQGLKFLHRTPLKFHGALTSKCCLIDSRWSLKISLDPVAISVLCDTSVESCSDAWEKLWVAPEVLRNGNVALSPASDVYSYAIIMQELLFREQPFFIDGEAVLMPEGESS